MIPWGYPERLAIASANAPQIIRDYCDMLAVEYSAHAGTADSIHSLTIPSISLENSLNRAPRHRSIATTTNELRVRNELGFPDSVTDYTTK